MAKGDFLFMTSMRKYLDHPHAVNLVDVRFRIGDHMMGIPGCFDLVKVTKIDDVRMGTRSRIENPIESFPQEYGRINMPPQKTDGRNTIASMFGPMPTDAPILYVYQASKADLGSLINVLKMENASE